jgi:hypothetical protein
MKLTNVVKVENLENEIIKITENVTTSKSLKMKELFQLGLDVKEISVIMKVRYNFVYNVISNQIIVESLVVETEKVESKKDLVKVLFNQGKSNKEIAIELKTNYNYIYKLTKELKDEIELENQKEVK